MLHHFISPCAKASSIVAFYLEPENRKLNKLCVLTLWLSIVRWNDSLRVDYESVLIFWHQVRCHCLLSPFGWNLRPSGMRCSWAHCHSCALGWDSFSDCKLHLNLCCWIQLVSKFLSWLLTGIVFFRLGDVALRPRLETERANGFAFCMVSCFIPVLLQPALALDLSFGGEQVLVSASCCAV